MSSEDLVSALQEAVRQEVVENYFRERRLLEEECNILKEDASAYHGGLAATTGLEIQLALLLLEPLGAETFFSYTGLRLPEGYHGHKLKPVLPLKRVGGLTRCRKYLNLVKALYTQLWIHRQNLREEYKRLRDLLSEVNADIKRFELNHDMLALTAYMRSLDPQELQRRKIMGVNFSHGETSAAAARLSFKTFSAEKIELTSEPVSPLTPSRVMEKAEPMLIEACRRNKGVVDEILLARKQTLESL